MDNKFINDIERLFKRSFQESDIIPLHSLLWTIDAKHHLIPTIEELNDVIKNIKGILINQDEEGIKLKFIKGTKSDQITQEHLNKAMDIYRKIFDGGKS